MFLGLVQSDTAVNVYKTDLKTNTYILLNQTFPSNDFKSWSLNTVNDSFILLNRWTNNVPVYALKSSSTISNTWSMVSLNATKVSLSEELADSIIDTCGRLWVVVYGFGIRIYDQSATVLLANWTVSTGLSDILFLDNYELFLSDYDGNQILHFHPTVQCTS